MNLLRCILLLQVATTLALGQSAPQRKAASLPNQPEALIRSLYNEVVARHPLGISVGGNMKLFAPYLSTALLHRIDLANACLDDWYRQNPDPNSKPPGLEGGLFTGDDLRAEPKAFRIERVQAEKNGSSLVYVKLTRGAPPEDTDIWRVAAMVVRENGHFVVDDVIYLKDNPQDVEVRLSEYLSQGCDGPRWVGHGNQQSSPKQQK